MTLFSLLHMNKTEAFLRARKEILNARCAQPSPVWGVKADKKFIMINRGTLHIFKVEDVLWVHRRSARMVCVYPRAGKPVTVTVATAKRAGALIAYLYPRLPYAAFGHSEELVRAWNADAGERYQVFHTLACIQH